MGVIWGGRGLLLDLFAADIRSAKCKLSVSDKGFSCPTTTGWGFYYCLVVSSLGWWPQVTLMFGTRLATTKDQPISKVQKVSQGEKTWQFWGCRNPALCQWFEEQVLKNRQAPIFLMICHDFPSDLPYINLKNPHFQTQPYDISVYDIPNMTSIYSWLKQHFHTHPYHPMSRVYMYIIYLLMLHNTPA